MTTGVLPFDDLKKKCHLNTGFFETSGLTEDAQMAVTSGNHDLAGLSIGNLQYNFGPADRAQEWFKYMIDNHVSIVNSAFGANTTELATFKNVINTYTRTNRIAWGDSISALVGNEKRALQQPYSSAFATMLISAEGKAKYYSMKDAYYWTPSYELFRHLSCISRLSCASLFDVYVNKGRYYPINLIVADFDAIDANGALTEAEKEAQKIYAINYRGNYDNAVNPVAGGPWQSDQEVFWHGDGVDDGRRGCMANQTGVYYGATYDPDVQFDMNQEPATNEKADIAPMNVKLGNNAVNNIFLGSTAIAKVYLGTTLIGGGVVSEVTSNRVPKTQFRTNAGNYAGIPNQSAVTLDAEQPLWIDCQEPFVGCRTFYTLDGSEPTVASNLYTGALTFSANKTLKTKTISVFGVAEATKTLAVTVNVPIPVTTISPSAVTQNSIPITVTLTSPYATTIYYKIGAGAQQTYTGPFTVNQNQSGTTSIPVTYWAENATGVEAQRTLTYNTSGATPAKPIVNVTNLTNAIRLDWPVSQNALSYSVYRSTTPGTLGTALATFISPNTYTDLTAVGGTIYYYTVRAGNYGPPTDSDQAVGSPYSITVYENKMVDFEGYANFTVYDATLVTNDFGNVDTLQGGTRLKTDSAGRLRFEMPIDQVGSANTGGIIKSKIAGKTEYTFDYEIRFDNLFPWSKGGKIPGVSGGVGYTGGEPAWPGDGFSVRLMWRENGKIIPYVYHKNQPDIYGDHFDMLTNGIGYFTYTKAYLVKIYVKLNTGANLDGILRVWLDDALIFEKTNICYRTDNSKIDTAHLAIFAGGSTSDWNMTGSSYIRLSHVQWQ
jgi:Chitobiase/beta-hexosaminidase C-terminal domain